MDAVTIASSPLLSQAEISRFVRRCLPSHVYDAAVAQGRGTAIYTLSDPRDLRATRYVGQTRAPRRRFLQHIGSARLWIPDELPWFVAEERYRPLYAWIRVLYRDAQRLPVMVVTAWVEGRGESTTAERDLIQSCVRGQMPLLNVESAALQPQIRLL